MFLGIALVWFGLSRVRAGCVALLGVALVRLGVGCVGLGGITLGYLVQALFVLDCVGLCKIASG